MKSKSSNKIFYISFSAILLLAVLHSCDIDSRHEFECLNTNPHNVTIIVIGDGAAMLTDIMSQSYLI